LLTSKDVKSSKLLAYMMTSADHRDVSSGEKMNKIVFGVAMLMLAMTGLANAEVTPGDPIVSAGIPGGPFPKCGAGEVGVTADGQACWAGPIFANPFSIQVSPDQRKALGAQQTAFCSKNPMACDPGAATRALCRSNPGACGAGNDLKGSPVPRTSLAFRYDVDASGTSIKQYNMDTGVLVSTYPNSPSSSLGPAGAGQKFQGPSWTPPPGAFPPDMAMALNPSTDMLVHVNNGLYFFDKYGNPMINFDQDEYTFWCIASQGAGGPLPDCTNTPTPGDTQVVFDYASNKWIVSALSSGHSYLYVAVSGPDGGAGPFGPWAYFYAPACSNYTPGSTIRGDKDVMGISNLRVVIDTRFCNSPGTPTNADTIYDLDKSLLVAQFPTFSVTTIPPPVGVKNVRPAYDYAAYLVPGSTREYLAAERIGVSGSFSGSIVDVYYIAKSGGTDQLFGFGEYPVDRNAVPTVPPGPQLGCAMTNCMIDTGSPDAESVFIQNNTNFNQNYLFTAFPVGQLGQPNISAIDLFAVNLNTSTNRDFVVAAVGSGQVLSFPSVAGGRSQGLYLNAQRFGPDRYPEGDVWYFNYYPLGSGIQLVGTDVVSTSAAMFNNPSTVDPASGMERWGDYTSIAYQPPIDGPTWSQDFYLIDEYTASGMDQSMVINGFKTPNF
jgi:hypothetical protein